MKQKHPDINFITLLILSLVIFVFESIIPRPLPWLKIGLANVVTLVSYFVFPLSKSFRLVAYRVLLGALFLGTFGTPGFWLSLSGALLAWIVMASLFTLGIKNMMVLSIHGAVFHYAGQMITAALIFIKSDAIFALAPYLILGATVSGFLVGWLATGFSIYLNRMDYMEEF